MIVLRKLKNPGSITHVQILDNYGKYYFKKVNGSFKGVLEQFDVDGQHLKNIKNLKSLCNGINFTKYLYYTRYILFRTVVVSKCGGWLSSLKQNPHFINSLTRLNLLKIAPPFMKAPTSLLI